MTIMIIQFCFHFVFEVVTVNNVLA